jgi:hypothetical protein
MRLCHLFIYFFFKRGQIINPTELAFVMVNLVLTPSVNRDIAEIHVYKNVHVDKSYKPFDLLHIYIFFENCRF